MLQSIKGLEEVFKAAEGETYDHTNHFHTVSKKYVQITRIFINKTNKLIIKIITDYSQLLLFSGTVHINQLYCKCASMSHLPPSQLLSKNNIYTN